MGGFASEEFGGTVAPLELEVGIAPNELAESPVPTVGALDDEVPELRLESETVNVELASL